MRLKNKRVDIDPTRILGFFNNRGELCSPDKPYTSVLYQDSNPDLAYRRDLHEKAKILPLLDLENRDSVIDIGCGIGRWADTIVDQVENYLGIDFSSSLIDIAKTRIESRKAKFLVMAAEDISTSSLYGYGPFNLVIVSGVFLYMNDREITQCLRGIVNLVQPGCIIYIREPLAVDERLTICGQWSDELNAEYNAIYRSTNEIEILIDNVLKDHSCTRAVVRPLYDDHSLNNRRETKQFFTILKTSA